MTPRLSQWSALALASMLALSACAGTTGPTMPSAPGFNQSASVVAQSAGEPHVANASVQPNVTCPKRYLDCDSVSKTKGAELIWCYGPTSDPCGKSDAGKVKWSGVVCLAKGATCKGPIKQLTAKWSGPFKCKSQDKCKGTFELDTIKPGPGLKETSKYLYKQDIHLCLGSSCEDAYVGLNVGP